MTLQSNQIQRLGKCSTVTVIADSINPDGDRLTTLQLQYPRILHAEFMTHRVFSRNASSSRAIPVARMNQQVRENPAMPIHWGANQKGMQADQENHGLVAVPGYLYFALLEFSRLRWEGKTLYQEMFVAPDTAWKFSAWLMAGMSDAYDRAGYHKQVANRLTEFGQWMSVVLTATEYDNFLALRDHHMAYPEIRDLAQAVRDVRELSTPHPLKWGEYHLPYLTQGEDVLTLHGKLMVSTARCGRVSYNRHDGEANAHSADFDLHDRLVGSEPQHFSPAEHPAVAMRGQYANFNGFASYRWQLERGVIVRAQGWEGNH